jgi:zinc transport system permease protein
MDFLQYDFMQRAMLAGIITALICPLIGIFVVVRRQSLIGDGLGHIAFAGVMGGYVLGIYPTAIAAVVTMLGAAAIELLRRRHAQHADTALAILFYSGIALAVVFSSMARVPGSGMLGVLFGSIVTVSASDLVLISLCGIIVLTVMFTVYKKMMLMAFDEDVARAAGINTGLINIVFAMLTALVVVVGMRVVGILLVSALMVVPVASAQLMRCGFSVTLLTSVAVSVLAVIAGLLFSFNMDIAPGGTIVLASVIIYSLMLIGFGTKLYSKLGQAKKSRTVDSPRH